MNKPVEPAAALPEGVVLTRLAVHADNRGSLYELHRDAPEGPRFAQWNVVRSAANSLRGVHVHAGHADGLHVISGTMVLGLHDLRPEDPARRLSVTVTLTGDAPLIACVPEGVCHGFWFPEPTLYVYGLTSGWDASDFLGCRWDDPALGLDWPAADPFLSPRDADPMSYDAMRAEWFAQRAALAAGRAS